MKLLLIDNLLFEGSVEHPRFDPQPHLGLMSLVAVTKAAGYEATILDPRRLLAKKEFSLDTNFYNNFAQAIVNQKAHVIGFTALGCNMHCVVQTAQILRQTIPDIPILLGGPHATILHRELIEAFDCFDIIVRHEAEHSLPLILKALEMDASLSNIPGITFKSAQNQIVENTSAITIDDLDSLPMPSYNSYPLDDMGLSEIRVEAGRGCPFNCTFCSTASFFGRQYRLKSAERMVSEMDKLHETYGFMRFKLNHDLFTVNRKKVLEFCKAASKRKYEWSCSARMDCVDADLLQAMADAGCKDIYFGVETGSARMQSISKKRLDIELIMPTLKEAQRLSIRSTTSFIAGYPQETQADLDETLDAVGWTHIYGSGQNNAQLHLLTPEPGTELIKAYKDKLRLDSHISEFNFPRLSHTDDALIQQHTDLFSNHHHFPTMVNRDRLIFTTDLWPVLYSLDKKALAFILSEYENRLSLFVASFYFWAEKNSSKKVKADMTNLTAYIYDIFGVSAPINSIIRFINAQASITNCSKDEMSVSADFQGKDLRLSPSAALLPACHDVPTLLKEGLRRRTTGAYDTGELSDWLLLKKHDGTRLYRINSEALHLLEMFSKPACLEDVIQKYVSNKDKGVFAPEDIANLVEFGALERLPASAESCLI